MATNTDSSSSSFVEAFANGHLVEKFNDHFEQSSQKWDQKFFRTSLYKRYFSQVLLGIATSMILSEECRKFNFKHLYHTGNDDMVRIIFTTSRNQALVNTFFMGSTDMELLKINNQEAEYRYHFNDDIRLLSGLVDSINIDLQPEELIKLKKLVVDEEGANFENYIPQYNTYEISPQFSRTGIKMRKIEHAPSSVAKAKLNFNLHNYAHANLNSNAIKKLTKNLIRILNQDPTNDLHVKELFKTLSLLSMKKAHLLTAQNFEPISHLSATETGRAGFFHGILESMKHLLPFSHVYMKPAVHLKYNGNSWDSDFYQQHKNSLLNYAKYGEPLFTPQNTFDRPIEQFTQYITDGVVDQSHTLHPVLYLTENDMERFLERKVQPVVVTFQHKTHPTINEMCKQGIRNDVILVSLRSNYDQWISVSKSLIRLHTIFSRFPSDEDQLLKYLERSFQAHLNFASFQPDNLARYLALNILGFLQTPKADYVYKAEPKSSAKQDASLLNLVLLDSHKKVVCLRFHDQSASPRMIDYEIKGKSILPRKHAIVVDVTNDGGSLVFHKSMVFLDVLSKYFTLKPILQTRLGKDLLNYAYSSHEKYSEAVRHTLSTVISMHSQYFQSQADLHAFLDGYSLRPDTIIKLGNYANEYTMAIKIPRKMKKWYTNLHKGEPGLEYVTLHFAYDRGSNPAKKALEKFKNLRQSFKVEDSRSSSKTGTFSIVFSQDKVTIACQRWMCNSEDVKSFFCQHTARKKRSASICSLPISQELSSAKNLHMEKLSKITHGIQSGFLVRDIIADLLNKDYKSLALTSGLLAGSGVTSYLGGKMKNAGMVTAGSCMTNIPFVAYNALDAYRSFQNHDQLTGYTDLLMIGLDSLCLADGLLLGLTGGVPILGEISFALSTILLISMNLYSAYKLVQTLNAQLELSPVEKFTEGMRALLHMKSEPLIDHLIRGKKADQFIVSQSLSSSQLPKNFKYYITAAATDFDQEGKLIYESDNFIDLRHTVHRRTKSRMMPNKIVGTNYFCVMDVTKGEISKWLMFISWIFNKPRGFQDYYCKNAFGMKFDQSKELALYDLFDGHDVVHGFDNVSNFFRVGSGIKEINGGDLDDVFFINSNLRVGGSFVGFSGRNTIDLTKYSINSRIYVSRGLFKIDSSAHEVRFSNISDFSGRKAAPETINIPCEFERLDSKGGSKRALDEIYILDDTCNYDLNIHVHENTIVNSSAMHGNVTFVVHPRGYKEIFIGKAVNMSYALVYQSTSLWDVTFHSEGSFDLNINSASGQTKIHSWHQEFTFYFLDAILLWNSNHAMAYINSNLSFETLFQKSLILSRQTGISVTAHSQEINQSLVVTAAGLQKISSSVTLVTSNDESHKSHVISLHEGNNVLRISALSNVTLYLSQDQNMTIDLHHFSHDMLVNSGREIYIQVETENFVKDCNVHLHIHTKDPITGKMNQIMSILILADDPVCFDNLIIQNYATSTLLKTNDQVELVAHDIHLFKKSMAYISAFTVETGNRLISDQNATDFSYYRFNRTLIVSNLHSDTTQDYMTIFFEEYSIHKIKFSSLIFEFPVNRNLFKLPGRDSLLDTAEEWTFYSDYDLSEDTNVEKDSIVDF